MSGDSGEDVDDDGTKKREITGEVDDEGDNVPEKKAKIHEKESEKKRRILDERRPRKKTRQNLKGPWNLCSVA